MIYHALTFGSILFAKKCEFWLKSQARPRATFDVVFRRNHFIRLGSNFVTICE